MQCIKIESLRWSKCAFGTLLARSQIMLGSKINSYRDDQWDNDNDDDDDDCNNDENNVDLFMWVGQLMADNPIQLSVNVANTNIKNTNSNPSWRWRPWPRQYQPTEWIIRFLFFLFLCNLEQLETPVTSAVAVSGLVYSSFNKWMNEWGTILDDFIAANHHHLSQEGEKYSHKT